MKRKERDKNKITFDDRLEHSLRESLLYKEIERIDKEEEKIFNQIEILKSSLFAIADFKIKLLREKAELLSCQRIDCLTEISKPYSKILGE